MEKASRMGAEAKSLTDEQKKRIAEERSKAEAKIAEAKIMIDEKIAKVAGQEAYAQAIEEARRAFFAEKAKIEEDLERRLEKIRAEG